MKVFFGKHNGKDISELDSSYLVWILECYENCEYILREACKSELSHRLGLNFEPPTDEQNELDQQEREIARNEKEIKHLKDIILISILTRNWNQYTADGYLNSPGLLKSDLELIREIQLTN